ncbi:MAG: hypothetical protein A2787_06610 [Omnitrophica WOR_2 bacterium RIFCSPHIGHO2_01_FULL_48_9]|nr:MAG: hypothetical protein A3D10_05465 [Omnitrophica WOR_2 bacterium RIFCSPHIGHO2_02_FULL_48_11]OGX30449.1 MAG: hypothetical protein A2787_06610 [Omnitrophica WOR_2 bacterium RIFCSPHIGHO2_01_FULL_48_9]
MSKEILIQIQAGEKRVAILNNGKLDDFYIEVDRYQSILGNVYKGRVESILPSINGAFVNIGQERNGFLYLTDAVNPLVEEDLSGPRRLFNKILNKKEDPPPAKPHNEPPQLKQGQEVLVQVVKEPFANKGARLTTHISLAGRFIVYMPYDAHHGVSKKIEDPEERKRLREALNEFTFVTHGGFIVRTVSMEQGKRELLRDAKFLVKIWQQIVKLSERKTAPALIYKEYDLLWKIVRDFLRDDVTTMLVDSRDEYIKLKKFVHTLIGREMVNKVQLYKGTEALFDFKNVSKELEKIYDTRVFLKSGSHIVIEQTEGLTVVDVNSGKFRTKASPEDAAFMVNLEAAPEIARQLRLRDLGGIIVIDFIDMTREEHKRKVLTALQAALEDDYAKTEVNRISSLGLVEMTRARTGKTLESIAFESCPYCGGRGRVKVD